MAAIDYPHFVRVLTRSEEIAAEKEMKPSVVITYEQVLKDAAQRFLAANANLAKAESAFGKENEEALAALRSIDGPYREARSTVAAFVPGVVLPETLKAQTTDTDKINAIESLLEIIEEHAGEKWADQLLAGAFGQTAGPTVTEINEGIAANKAVSAAREERAAAYGPAYERHLRFKRVVRDTLGSKSVQYKRIHVRNPANDASDAPEAPEPAPAPKTPPTS
ncbi:Hypothetical protein A7982_09913 [Minicystis rosea]|nr:Hypothetical protein A7982_09913 [Minicystis rosea]